MIEILVSGGLNMYEAMERCHLPPSDSYLPDQDSIEIDEDYSTSGDEDDYTTKLINPLDLTLKATYEPELAI